MTNQLIFGQFCVFVILGYLCGNIIFGLIISKIKKINLREQGSGNLGATNALRILGKWFGILIFIFDLLKTWIAIFLSVIIYKYWNYNYVGTQFYQENGFIVYYSAAFVVIGHCFPIIYIFHLLKSKFNFKEAKKFSGGKGAAATAGFFMSVSPWVFLIAFSLFMIVFFIYRYVSLASIISISTGMFFILIPQIDYFYMLNIVDSKILDIPNVNNFDFINYSTHWKYIVNIFCIGLIISIIVVYRHKTNILNLKNHKEKKLFSKKTNN